MFSWLLYGLFRCPPTVVPAWLVDWASVLTKLLRFQLSYLAYPLDFQVPLFSLIWGIEVNRLMEKAVNQRLNKKTCKGSLPHVEIPSSSKQKEMMKKDTTPFAGDIVLIGGGHSHVFVVKSFGMKPEPGAKLTLISESTYTPYSGMLPGHIAGQYTSEECHIDLGRLCQFGGTRLILGRVYKVDPYQKLVYVTGRPPMRYDVLSIDIGSSPQLISSENTFVTPVKPISQFSAKWEALIQKVSDSPMTRFVIVGAGAGGCELALSMEARLKHLTSSGRVKFTIISNKSVVCPSHNKSVQRKFMRILKMRSIEVVLDFEVVRFSGKVELHSKDGRTIQADECIWCTSAVTQSWMGEAGISVDQPGGFVRVRDTLESENMSNVFAAGDCANMINHPRPKAGVFAVRQGPPLSNNLRTAFRRLVLGKVSSKLESYVPQRTFLGIIGTGAKHCVASSGIMCLEGSWLYHLKDWIDRRWMAGYTSQLPVMPPTPNEKDGASQLERLKKASQMRCGGCGAKVGKSVLDRVVERLNPPTRDEVTLGLDAPDDCAIVQFGETAVAQTVDFFRSFYDDPYVFGQIAANHALSDCYAMCSQPISAMAIAVVPFASENVVEGVLTQMMAGVCSMLEASNCALVGGHSCEGSELALGLSVSGVVNQGDPLTKGGIRKGDILVVTKPIGTGVIFASHMRNVAKGEWVQEAINKMLQSNQEAALQAKKHGATACTDITGFGLAGHLTEMMNASDNSNLCAKIVLDNVPLLPGALETVKEGIFSSLQPQNVRAKHSVANHAEIVTTRYEEYSLLFDPQTSGGLLVTMPRESAQRYIDALHELNLGPGAIIGEIVDNSTNDDYKITIV